MKENYPLLNRKTRKQREVERQAGMSSRAKWVKLEDVIDNSIDIVRNDKDFVRKNFREMENPLAGIKGGRGHVIAKGSTGNRIR